MHFSPTHFFSHFLYPNKSWSGGDGGGNDASSSGDGKYELLSAANNLIAEEIRNIMSKSKRVFARINSEVFKDVVQCSLKFSLSHMISVEVTGNSTDTLLAGSLAKALCCILFMKTVLSFTTCSAIINSAFSARLHRISQEV